MPGRKRHLTALAIFLAGAASGPAFAVDGVSITGGVGAGNGEGSDRRIARVALQWDWDRRWFQDKGWHIGGFWNVDAGYVWQSDVLPGQNKDLFEIGFTPVFRLQPNGLKGPYVEGSIGIHFLSRTSIGDDGLGTSFQFGSAIGFGYRFGAKESFDLSYRYQHVSNAGIKDPNGGLDFHLIRLQYHF